jgi:hypothetical protein
VVVELLVVVCWLWAASLSTVECLGIADPVISMGAVGDALCVGEVWAAACSDGSASVVYVLPESPFFDVLLDDVGGFFLPFSARKFRHIDRCAVPLRGLSFEGEIVNSFWAKLLASVNGQKGTEGPASEEQASASAYLYGEL